MFSPQNCTLEKNKECIKTATPSDILSILHMYTLLGRTSQKEREIKKKKRMHKKHTHVSMKKCGTYNVEAATYPCSHGVQSKKNEWQKAVPM